MKNFESILADANVELTDEQKTAIIKDMAENYKPVSDWQKQVDKVKALEGKVSTTEEALKKFDGVDADALNAQIANLKADLEKKDAEYQSQLADRDFNDTLKDCISAANGRSAKAIIPYLDVDTLKKSSNQKEDIANALKEISEAEETKFLFGEAEPNVSGTGNPIGAFGSGNAGDAQMAKMRAAMGLTTKGDK